MLSTSDSDYNTRHPSAVSSHRRRAAVAHTAFRVTPRTERHPPAHTSDLSTRFHVYYMQCLTRSRCGATRRAPAQPLSNSLNETGSQYKDSPANDGARLVGWDSAGRDA